jgi:hypothetical protein
MQLREFHAKRGLWLATLFLLAFHPASDTSADSTRRTLVIGDSIAHMMFLHGAFPDNFVQLAAGGATTGYAAERLQGAIDFYNGPMFRPQVANLVVFLGVNDYEQGVDLESFRSSYRKLLSFKDNASKLFCIGMPPIAEKPDRLPLNAYSAPIRNICESNGGTYIDPGRVLLKDGAKIADYFAADNTHLTFDGSQALGHYIIRILDGCER